jgi:tryptophan synthase beta chain
MFTIPKVKVCGLTRAEDAQHAVAAGAEAVGVVIAKSSPRCATPAQACAVFAAVPQEVLKVLVTTSGDPIQLIAAAKACGATAVQLCGDHAVEPWADFPLPILRRLPVSHDAWLEIQKWQTLAAAFVLDSPSTAGGSGEPVDFELAARLAAKVPCLLAGGLDFEIVARAIKEVQPLGVDASSRLESSPGIKDHSRVTQFVKIALQNLPNHSPAAGTKSATTIPQAEAITNAGPYFGDFGGCFAPETLMASLLELESAWKSAIADDGFCAELEGLLRDYAGRATPLTHVKRLSAELGVEVWLKREDLLHTGAHKLNNALGQALLAKRMGKKRILAETGAGQHGVATATVCALLDLECVIYMGAVDVARQRPNVQRMELLGARVEVVENGQRTLKDAINEAMRAWVADPDAHYLLGSALGPHPFPALVAGFQQVIGKEARQQFEQQAGGVPDVVVACVGGGSNAIGMFRGFTDLETVELVGVEAGGEGVASGKHAARFQGGVPGVLHGCFTWLLQDEHGQICHTHSISAGLDYAAVGPEHAELEALQRARYEDANDEQALAAFQQLARLEGIVPALESSHAVAWVVAQKDKLQGKRVLINLSGRGDKDLDSVFALLKSKEAGNTGQGADSSDQGGGNS